MKARLVLALLAGAGMTALPAAPAAAQQAERDWSETVAVTPEGGYRMGNPDAPVQVVEFVSLTCGHCATFSAEGMGPLVEEHVRTGAVSFELRNFFLNAPDLVAAIVSRCAAPEDYFALSGEILKEQRTWLGRIQAMSEAEHATIGEMDPLPGMARVADLSGLDDIAARHGVTPDALAACFADESRASTLVTMRQAAEADFGVQGTPSFAVGGRLAPGVHDWAGLEPLLRPEGGGS